MTRVDLAGLLGMTTMPSLTDPLWNLNPVGPVPGPLAPCCGGPLLDCNEDRAVLARPAKPWTSACREVCANLWPWCSDWSSSADELTGPLDASSVGCHLWNVECWTASQWTGSLDLEWDQTSRSWWSSQELEHPEGCLGVQLSLFRSICPDQPVV